MTKESRGVGRCCSRTDFSNLFTRPRDSRKACCTRGHVFEIREIDSSVCARVCRVCSREEDECILITRSLPMTPGNRVYVASVSTRHCVYVHPRATAIHALLQTHKHTHTHTWKSYQNVPFMQMNATILYTSIYEKRKEKGGDGCRLIKMN